MDNSKSDSEPPRKIKEYHKKEQTQLQVTGFGMPQKKKNNSMYRLQATSRN